MIKKSAGILSVLLVIVLCLSLSACGKEAKINEAFIKNNELSVDLTFPGAVQDYDVRVEFENHDPNTLDGIVYYDDFRLASFPNQIQTVDFSDGKRTFKVEGSIKFKGTTFVGDTISIEGSDLKSFFGEDVTARCIILKDNKEVSSMDVTFE